MEWIANFYAEIARLWVAAGYADAAIIASARSGQPIPPETVAAIDKARRAVKTLGLRLQIERARRSFVDS